MMWWLGVGGNEEENIYVYYIYNFRVKNRPKYKKKSYKGSQNKKLVL